MLTCILIIIIIIIVILIAVAIYYNYSQQNYVYYNGVKYYNGKNGFFNLFNRNKKKSGFSNSDSGIINNVWDVPPALQSQNYWKRAAMNQNIDMLQGPNTDPAMFKYIYPENGGNDINMGYKQCTGFGEDTKCTNFYNYMSKNNPNAGNNVLNAKISTAEQEMWMANRNDPSVKMDNNLGSSLGAANSNLNADYNSYINSLVVDERTLDNHLKWANEMLPWSGTARTVDNMDEALSNSGINWLGLRRPQPIAQSNESLFVTELGPKDFINNPKFNFKS